MMKPRINAGDLIALVIISGCFVLIALGKSETTASTLLISICAFYFGKNSNQPAAAAQNQPTNGTQHRPG